MRKIIWSIDLFSYDNTIQNIVNLKMHLKSYFYFKHFWQTELFKLAKLTKLKKNLK